jgi:glutathione S-transferase
MIKLHHCHQSRSMRSLWLLNELGVPFETQIYPFDMSIKTEAYLALNPAGRVPAVELDDEVIWETGAIAEILCERFPDAGLGRLPGETERNEWLIWLHFAETISQHAAALTQQHIMLFEDHMRSPVVTKIEPKRLAKCYAALNDQLAGRDYILAGGFSAADIGIGQGLYMSRHFAAIDDYENVVNWYDRITVRPGFIASLPPEGVGLYTKPFYPPVVDPGK